MNRRHQRCRRLNLMTQISATIEPTFREHARVIHYLPDPLANPNQWTTAEMYNANGPIGKDVHPYSTATDADKQHNDDSDKGPSSDRGHHPKGHVN